jgi:hypothetical protein
VKLVKSWIPAILLVVLVLAPPVNVLAQSISPDEFQTTNLAYVVGEGNDFATRILRDPWDMSDYLDVSQWINQIGPNNALIDIQVQNGLFSARTTGPFAYFYTLFSGYPPGMKIGKIGNIYPIPSNQYSCFYMAMYTEAPFPSYYQFTWGDGIVPTVSGMPYGLLLSGGSWKLYQLNLKTWPYISGSAWTSRPQWQSFRIVPNMTANAPLIIDWVRLTDCNPVNVNLSNIPPGNYSISVGAGSPERRILAVDQFSPQANGSYAWDVQGLAPGSYTYYIRPSSPPSAPAIQQGQLTVKPAPIVHFTNPSPTSGEDYATQAGIPWDMNPASVTSITCASYSFNNGILSIDTLPPSMLPPQCIGAAASEADPRMTLSTPVHGDLSAYRYLSMSTLISGVTSLLDGMIIRFTWILHRPSGENCYYVSREIPVDVGWHTYYADLYDLWNGSPASVVPAGCPNGSWLEQASIGSVIGFSLDPNENISQNIIHQEFDWICLTQVERAVKGNPFTVKIQLNEPSTVLQTLTFYYTSDRQNPTQHLAKPYLPLPDPSGPFKIYLPGVLNLPNSSISAERTFNWDTSDVSPGEYTICSVANDGYNQVANCSDAPVNVVTP